MPSPDRQHAHISRAGPGDIGHQPAAAGKIAAACRDLDQAGLVRGITRYARTVREPSLALAELDEAISRAFGEAGEPGPCYIDFPDRHAARRGAEIAATRRASPPEASGRHGARSASDVAAAVDLLWSARRVASRSPAAAPATPRRN